LNRLGRSDARLVRKSRVAGWRGFTIYTHIARGAFAKVVPLGGDRVAWVETEIRDWIIERIEVRDVA